MWFLIALIGYTLLAVVFIMDKFILTKSVGKPVVYAFYSTIFLFGALVLLPFGGGVLHGVDWVWALVSGISFGFAMLFMFIALKYGETSHISPFIGAVVLMGTFWFSSQFLGESLSSVQMVGMGVLLVASLMLSFEKSRKHNGFHVGFVWAIVSGMLFAVSHVSAKYIYSLYPFITGFAWTRATTGLVGLFLLLFPSVRRSFKPRDKKDAPKTEAKRHAMAIVVSDKMLSVLGIVLIQYAIAVGSVTLVNAMAGIQYVLMFLLVLLLTKFVPRVFQEVFTRREVVVQVVALILVVVGSALFVF